MYVNPMYGEIFLPIETNMAGFNGGIFQLIQRSLGQGAKERKDFVKKKRKKLSDITEKEINYMWIKR